MRVIAGIARGRRLEVPEGRDIRPTTDKVKEAIFSAIQFDIPGAVVLDLFAGSGQLGIEALSRGARMAVFVDARKESLDLAVRNVETTGFTAQAQFSLQTAETFLQSNRQKFDLVLLDPPYGKGILLQLLPKLEAHLAPGAAVIAEHETSLALPEACGALHLQKTYKYSAVIVSRYRLEA